MKIKNNKKLPNFLIVGAAKSGTSSLYKYLSEHGQIFMSPQKEPRFITSQIMDFPLNGPKDHLVESWYVKNFDQYTKLFEGVSNEIAIGEASADTLYFHEKTIPVIKKYLNDVKIIIILRNPVERSISAYKHLVRDGREHLSFEEGLEAENLRIERNFELIYHYKEVSKYYDCVKNFLDNFDEVKVVFNEDLRDNPEKVMEEIFGFLNVEKIKIKGLSRRFNVSGKPKSRLVHYLLFEDNKLKGLLKPVTHALTTKEFRMKASLFLFNKNLNPISVKKETKTYLYALFQEDIEKLGKLLNKDLSFWSTNAQ